MRVKGASRINNIPASKTRKMAFNILRVAQALIPALLCGKGGSFDSAVAPSLFCFLHVFWFSSEDQLANIGPVDPVRHAH